MHDTDENPSTDVTRAADAQGSPELNVFIGTIFGSASIEVDTMLGNEVGYFRLKRALRIGEKSRKLLEKYGIPPQQVPHRTAVPLLEAASLEEDDELQDRWAALLANAAGGTVDVPPGFANVLRELDADAARMLDFVYARTMSAALDIQHRVKIAMASVRTIVDLTRESADFHLDNLIRLGVLRRPNDVEDDTLYESAQLTAFGRSFVKACRPPGAPDPPVEFVDLAGFRAHVQERRAEEAAERVEPGTGAPN